MSNSLTVGVLIPSSSIFPMGKNFERALRKVLKEDSDTTYEVIPEFTGQGEIKKVEDAVTKMLEYHDADVITGILPSSIIANVGLKLKGKRQVLIANNLGESLPPYEILREPNIIANSYNLWKQMWSLGYWAVKNLGKKGMIVGSAFDVGYSLQGFFDKGMLAADAESKWSVAVTPMPPAGELSDPEIVVEFLEKDMPDFVFPLFCGQEASLFLDAFIKRGLQEKIAIVATPYLLENFDQDVEKPLTIYTTLLAGREITHEDLDKDWTSTFGVFAQMGQETGQIIVNSAKAGKLTAAKEQDYASERGRLSLREFGAEAEENVYLVENKLTGKKEHLKRTLQEALPSMPLTDKEVEEESATYRSSWQNPYLGI